MKAKKKLLLFATILGIVVGYLLIERNREIASYDSHTFRYYEPLKKLATKKNYT